MWETFMKKGSKKERKNTVAIKIALTTCLIDLYEHLTPRTRNTFSSLLLISVWSSFKALLAVVPIIKA